MKKLNEMTISELRSLQNQINEEIKGRRNTRTGAVIFIIHVGNYREIAQLFITHLPKDLTARELKSLIDETGYWFGEFGQKWANHSVVVGLSKQNSDVRNAYLAGDVETVSYDELVAKSQEAEYVN